MVVQKVPSLTNGECVGNPDPITGECPPGTELAGAECVGEPLQVVGEPTCEEGELNPATGQCDSTTTSTRPLSCGEGETLVTTGPNSAECQPPMVHQYPCHVVRVKP